MSKSNVYQVALSVVREMLPTDDHDGVDVGSDEFDRLIAEHSEGEHFSGQDLMAEVRRVLKVIGTGRLNSDLFPSWRTRHYPGRPCGALAGRPGTGGSMNNDCSPEVLRRLLDSANAALGHKSEEIAELKATVDGLNVALQNAINAMMKSGLHREALAALDSMRTARRAEGAR
jgi:hypothetical protein